MRMLIAGANGKVARLLLPLLVARGRDVRGPIRDESQARTVRAPENTRAWRDYVVACA